MSVALMSIAAAWVFLFLAIGGLVLLPMEWQDVWHKITLGACLLCAIVSVIAFVVWMLASD